MKNSARSLFSLFVTNFFGTMNDNFLKTLASFTVIGWIGDERIKSIAMGITAAALVLPQILLSPLADRLTALTSKRKIVVCAKWAELPIIGIGVLGFMLHSPWLVVGAVFLMGVQSSLFSPAKYALIRDIAGEKGISTGMGWMEGCSFLGVLTGTIAAAIIADFELAHPQWHISYVCLSAFAALGLLSSFFIRAKEEANRAIHSVNPVRYVSRMYRVTKRYEGLNVVVFALSVFWWGAASLQMGLLVYGASGQGLGLNATQTGLLLSVAAVGIVVGQILAGIVDRKRFLLGGVLFTGSIASGILFAVYFFDFSPLWFGVMLGLLAFDLGFYKLPLDTEIQKVVKGAKLNSSLAYLNQVSFLFMLFSSASYALVSYLFGMKAFFLMLAIVFAAVSVFFALSYRPVLVFTGRLIFSLRYKVRSTGLEVFDSSNKVYLVLPNHPAMVDPMLVTAELWKVPLKPLSDEAFLKNGFIAPYILDVLGAVAVPDLRKHKTRTGAGIARGLADVVKNALKDGKNVIFYPSGHIWTEPKEEIGTRQLAYNVCKSLQELKSAGTDVAVVGIRTSGLWGSIWSRKGRKSSPPFAETLLKSVFLWLFYAPFAKRRRVDMHIEDLTDDVRLWAEGTRLEFNARLEEWYAKA